MGEASILKSIKKVVGVGADDPSFDVDILMHINSIFSTLTQVGIGPDAGFAIEDDTPTWSTFLGDDPRLNSVKSYISLRVRLLFDPPTTSYVLNAWKEQIQEFEWRLNVHREGVSWTDPDPVDVPTAEE